VRYAILAITVLALLAAGAAYELRGPSSPDVPAIELRHLQEDERRPRTTPEAPRKREESSEVSRGIGATPAPAQAPAPAGGDDEGGDDSWDNDGDDGGEDD
jgi:hypothetical protein